MFVGLAPELRGLRALVTGGTRGIVAAMAQRLSMPARAWWWPRQAHPTFPQTRAQRFVAADIATPDGVAELAERTVQLLGGIDMLVSNAGGQTHRPEGALHFTDEDWQRDLDTNLLSAVRVDRALLPAMIAQRSGGHRPRRLQGSTAAQARLAALHGG